MAREIELKLAVPPKVLDRVAELPWLREMASGPATREKLVTVYFDTSKRRLREAGLSLRIRHAGKKRLQTIKTLGKGTRGPFGRDEWEAEIGRDQPDLKLAAGTALEKLASGKLKRKLRPVFKTMVRRIAIPLRCDGSDVELAIDRGYIGAGGHREPISEIELELKSGDPEVLGVIAERLARSVPASYAARAKAERGYALSAGEERQPVGAEPIALSEHASSGEAFTAIGLSCLKQLVSNQDAVRRGKAEGVHQMRVGLRRLRAAIWLFRDMLRGAETEAIKAELKWLTGQLGPTREVEVLIEDRVLPLRQTAPGTTGVGTLQRDLGTRRDRALGQAKAALVGERYRRLGLRAALWLAQGSWSQTTDAPTVVPRERPAQDFAHDALGKLAKKIVKKIETLDEMTVRERHKLRIAIKKLRYGVAFFANFFAGRKLDKRRRRTDKILKSLQSSLGTLNDIEAHKRLAKTVIGSDGQAGDAPRKRAEKSFAMGFITGQEQKQIAACLAATAKAGKRLSETRQFRR